LRADSPGWSRGDGDGRRLVCIFAELIIIPILNIYRTCYGTRMMLTILGSFYAIMALAGYIT